MTAIANIDNMKSYKTEANLMAALDKLGFNTNQHRFFVVCNRAGRFTAVFQFDSSKGGYVGLYAQHGFLTV